MATLATNEIENQFSKLSPATQLGLLERLLHQVRRGLAGQSGGLEADLARMASDPEIQNESSRINAEFGPTESDGLGKV